MAVKKISQVLPATLMQAGIPAGPERKVSQWVNARSWRFEEYDARLAPVMPAVKRFATDVLWHRRQPDVLPYWLTILGPSGIGKTLILQQLYRTLANNTERWPILTDPTNGSEREAQCAHVTAGQDLEDHRAPREYGRYELIYLEDYGATSGKGAGAVTLDRSTELLLYRPKRWTIIDANMSFAELGGIAPRVASRLLRDGSILLEIPKDVPDYNLR